MAKLMLRTKQEEDEQIEKLKAFLSMKTASTAILAAATDYIALSREKDELIRELASKDHELEELKETIRQYKQAQVSLFKCID